MNVHYAIDKRYPSAKITAIEDEKVRMKAKKYVM
jgi:hypothetical protein